MAASIISSVYDVISVDNPVEMKQGEIALLRIRFLMFPKTGEFNFLIV